MMPNHMRELRHFIRTYRKMFSSDCIDSHLAVQKLVRIGGLVILCYVSISGKCCSRVLR